MVHQRLWFNSSVIGLCLTVAGNANGQIIPDGTTLNTSVLGNCQTSCDITGGNVAGQNLFHSFEEFNISTGNSVYFADPGVANIFSRVTGNNPSSLFGTLGVTGGDANLFLLNPNGIIFSEGATLDLRGSFFASTADEIQFGEHSFSTNPTNLENTALLTINPSALFFNSTGQDGSIELDAVTLTVPPQQNITLLGEGSTNPGILLKNSRINVFEGNVALGAVNSNGVIGIDDGLKLKFPNNVIRGDISLTAGSQITARNLGNIADNKINLTVNNLNIQDNSEISTVTTSVQSGAEIKIDAQGTVRIIGEDSNAFQEFLVENLTPGGNTDLASSSIQTNTLGIGSAGNIKIQTTDLLIDNGAGIVSSTRELGESGNIDLEVTNNFTLSGSGLLTGSGTFTLGNVGEINIDTKQLLVEQKGAISSSTLGNGNAGRLNISASDWIKIGNTPSNSIIPTGIYSNTVFGDGMGGDLTIDTPRLTLQNGGQLSASSGAVTSNGLIHFGGEGGHVVVNADESIAIKGRSEDQIFSSSILSDTISDTSAGNLTLNTDNLLVDSYGFISASSIGTGAGGNITVNARDSVQLNGAGMNNFQELISDGLTGQLDPANIQSGIGAFTIMDGVAGDITVNTSSLSLDNGAIISTATFGNDHAGNLQINASEEIDVRGSAIISPTFGAGNGGTLDLNTTNLSITEGGAIASASLGSGQAGNLNIWATESISILKTIPDLLFSGSISTGNYSGLGLSGDLNIDTQRLTIRDGANIQANNVFIVPPDPSSISLDAINNHNNQGKLTINASESIEISGRTFKASALNDTPNSHISSSTTTSNSASNVTINTGKLSVFDHGEINVSSFGEGAAGRLSINADSLVLKGSGNLNGTTNSGRGGNIDLRVKDILRLSDRSVIDTNAIALGNGGNIDISANFVIASGNSSISANAAAIGNGGNINIAATDVFLTNDSTITADSALGLDGTVKIETLFDTEKNNYTKLPQKVIQPDSRITRSCSNNGRQGVFGYTGRGGLPFNPLTDFQPSDIIIADFDVLDNSVSNNRFVVGNKTLNVSEPAVVEADQWQVNDQGKIELVAFVNSNSIIPKFNPTNCPFSNYK